jgi:hypothetical protein
MVTMFWPPLYLPGPFPRTTFGFIKQAHMFTTIIYTLLLLLLSACAYATW